MASTQDSIEYRFSLKPNPDPELGHYVMEFTGEAIYWDEELGEERVVAELEGYRLDLAGAIVDHLDQQQLLESVNPEISDFAEVVFNGQGCRFIDPASGALDRNRPCDGLVYIHRILVDPAMRGQNIGTQLIRRIGEMLNVENCLIGLKAWPIAEDGVPVKDPLQVARVKAFYQQLGFQPVAGDFMVKEGGQCESMRKRLAWRRKHEAVALHA